MKLDHRLIILDEQVLHVKLRALRKNLTQLGEGVSDEVLLAAVVSGEGVGPHHGPIDVVSYLFEEGSAVAVLKSLENFANTVGCNSDLNFSFSGVCQRLLRWVNGPSRWPALTQPSSFIRSLTWMFSSERTACLISRHSPPSARPSALYDGSASQRRVT
jgi:hypothetical protein